MLVTASACPVAVAMVVVMVIFTIVKVKVVKKWGL